VISFMCLLVRFKISDLLGLLMISFLCVEMFVGYLNEFSLCRLESLIDF
jgi:hypothetical protein